MWGLVLKDMFLLKRHWFKGKYAAALLIVLILSFLFLKESSLIVVIFITMLLLNSIQMLFVDDKKSGWTAFLNTATNFKERKIVLGRYTSAITVILITNLIFSVLNIGIYFIYQTLPIEGAVLVGFIALCISSLYMLVLIPFTYLFEQNGMIFVLLFIIISGFLVSRIKNIDVIASKFINETSNFLLFILVIAGLIIAGLVSYGISAFIYRRRFMY